MSTEPHSPRGIFVIGAPRSGTTAVGSYIGSVPEVLDLGEFGGFHLAYSTQARIEQVSNRHRAPRRYGPSPYAVAYGGDLVRHTHEFVERRALEHKCWWYCDATPWNVSVAPLLDQATRGSFFVLMLRHYAGTIQSLRRSYASGFSWAGKTWAESARVWSEAYSSVGSLPLDRTIVVSYEALTEEPEPTMKELQAQLEGRGLDASAMDLGRMTVSHAAPATGPRPTIGVLEGGQVRLQPIANFDAAAWSGDIHADVWPEVADVHHRLRELFPREYRSPAPPRQLFAHDDALGLVAEAGFEW